MPAFEEGGNEYRPDVAGSAGDKYVHIGADRYHGTRRVSQAGPASLAQAELRLVASRFSGRCASQCGRMTIFPHRSVG
jgi:hypothetical protein